MPRKSQNQLAVTALADGRFYLSGYVNGAQVRLKFADDAKAGLSGLERAEAKKRELENEGAQQALLDASKPLQQFTRLSPERLHIAEALFTEFSHLPRPFAEYIRAGVAVIGVGSLTKCVDAQERWRIHQIKEEKLDEGTTVDRNQRVLTAFLADSGAVYVSDITNAAIEEFCSLGKIEAADEKRGASMYSKISRAAVIRAFLNFCVAKKIITKTPFEMNMKTLNKLAKGNKERPKLLSPVQAQALLETACRDYPAFVPYLILSIWCFTRPSEAKRITPVDVKLDRAVPFIEPASNKVGTASYRTTNIPANVLPLLRQCIESGLWPKGETPYFSVTSFRNLRGAAGLIKFGPYQSKGFRPVLSSYWQANIGRHTGISMLYQQLSEKADLGTFREESVIAAVTRQAGNSEDVAFEHYVNIADAAQSHEFFKTRCRLTPEAIAAGKEFITATRGKAREDGEGVDETEENKAVA